MMIKMRRLVTTALLVILAAGTFLLAGYGFGRHPEWLQRQQVLESDATIIFKELNEVAELAVYRYEYSNVIISKTKTEMMGIEIPLSENIKLIKYQGYLKSGTDFGKLKIDVDEAAKSVKVTAGKSVILENVVRTEKTVVEDIKGQIFSGYPSQLIIDEINRDKKAMEDQAIAGGFLEESDRRLRSLLETVIRQMGYEAVAVMLE